MDKTWVPYVYVVTKLTKNKLITANYNSSLLLLLVYYNYQRVRPLVTFTLCRQHIVPFYWVPQKLSQIYTANHATFPIGTRKITVQHSTDLR